MTSPCSSGITTNHSEQPASLSMMTLNLGCWAMIGWSTRPTTSESWSAIPTSTRVPTAYCWTILATARSIRLKAIPGYQVHRALQELEKLPLHPAQSKEAHLCSRLEPDQDVDVTARAEVVAQYGPKDGGIEEPRYRSDWDLAHMLYALDGWRSRSIIPTRSITGRQAPGSQRTLGQLSCQVCRSRVYQIGLELITRRS
jgi:hypothetical protein